MNLDNLLKIFASIGVTISVISAIPQIYKLWKDKSSKDLSIYTLCLNLTGVIIMEIYAFYFKLWEIFLPNLVSLTFIITQIIMKYCYDKLEKTYQCKSCSQLIQDNNYHKLNDDVESQVQNKLPRL